MSEPLDLDKIEEEMKDFISWKLDVYEKERYFDYIEKSGKQIAALVKMVREQAQYIIALEVSCKELLENLKPIFKAYEIEFCNEYEAILKRGLDEIES